MWIHKFKRPEIFFEGNPALLGDITLFNTKANWFNAYNEMLTENMFLTILFWLGLENIL